MPTTISINGGRWYGEKEPADIEVLKDKLKTHPLDPWAAHHYGDKFVSSVLDRNGSPTGEKRFWGNFAGDPHAFDLRTDEKPLIDELSGLIAANMESEAFLQAKRAAGIKR